MKHMFDVAVAEKYGINAAILLDNVGYWVKQNEANETNYYEGYYWTFNSRRAFKELFPYMSERQIDTAFQKLIEDGIVITGNFNKSSLDRTLWYTLTQKGKCILHFDGMDSNNLLNAFHQNVRPIPDINTDINTDINNCTTSDEVVCRTDVQRVVDAWNDLQIAPISKLASGTKRYDCLRARIREYGIEKVIEAIERIKRSDFLRGQNSKSWTVTFDWFVRPNNFVKVLEGQYDSGNGADYRGGKDERRFGRGQHVTSTIFNVKPDLTADDG